MRDVVRVVTLNLWGKQGDWPARLALIRRELERLQPDVVALQEVLMHTAAPDHQAVEVARDLGYWVAYGGAWHIGDGLHLGNALLSRFPVASAASLHLPAAPGAETRALLAVVLTTPAGPWRVYNTHLDWEFDAGARRLAQLDFITGELARPPAGREALPPLLCGDLNAEPESDEIRFLRGLHPHRGRSVYLADCFALAGQGAGHTYARSNPYAARLGEPDRRIDYVLSAVDLNASPAGRGGPRPGWPRAARLCFTAGEGPLFPTDHYGIYVELEAGSLDK